MKKLIYKIGDFVIVSKTQMRERQGKGVTWRTALPLVTTTPRLGQVVGLCTRFDGYFGHDRFDSDFVPTRSHQFWLVRFGLTNRAVEVAGWSMRMAVREEIQDLPYRWPPQRVSERVKQNLREDSKRWPRDARGRWVSGPMMHGS